MTDQVRVTEAEIARGKSVVAPDAAAPPTPFVPRSYNLQGDAQTIYTPPQEPAPVPERKRVKQRFTVQIDILHGSLTPEEVQIRVAEAFDNLKVVEYVATVAKG